ncbi:MAG: hypothetical protein PVH29_12340 [Candidatus Zixiibacteriota bacterium]|jgi:hypothetical protein
MAGIVDEVQDIARGAAAAACPPAQLGEVLGADQGAFRVRVRLQPSGIETDWLRVAAPLFAWADVVLPEAGDEVLVVTAAGEQIVVARMFNAVDAVPSDGKEAARKGDACSCSEAVVGDHGPHSHTVVIDEGTGKVKLVD